MYCKKTWVNENYEFYDVDLEVLGADKNEIKFV